MKIGIVGSPESGKSEVALALAGYFTKNDESSHIVDNYIERAETDYNLTFGFFATYIGNIACALARFREERTAPEVDNVITCGTMLETMIYAAADGVNSERYSNLKEEHFKRGSITMSLMGVFSVDLMMYDQIFYLPYTGEHDFLQEFDKNIPALFEMWNAPFIKLEGSLKEKLATATDSLKNVEEEEGEDD